MKALKIPEATVMRLSVYSRHLAQLAREGTVTISSGEIARGVGVSSAQVRKDLAYFGEFGTRGVGYNVQELYNHILRILGLNNCWNVIIVGAGKLGSALAMYRGFEERGFKVRAVLDAEPAKVGQQLGDLVIEDMSVLADRVREHGITIGIVTVPAEAAQSVTDQLVQAGVRAVLNFTPRVLKVPERVVLRNVDLSVNLEVLSFNLFFGNQRA
ncbi:MAG: redox-sensing transcriptional repressor Rex [Syntrophomonadaceae bacterium]|nr:redox-sensing transcriptional repressor Rex [Syntrophomonadaceae bacterium]MDH7497896.1 redox-sensing transcriptional repressor Rex [Syntrophomonadaceae bacterium]